MYEQQVTSENLSENNVPTLMSDQRERERRERERERERDLLFSTKEKPQVYIVVFDYKLALSSKPHKMLFNALMLNVV